MQDSEILNYFNKIQSAAFYYNQFGDSDKYLKWSMSGTYADLVIFDREDGEVDKIINISLSLEIRDSLKDNFEHVLFKINELTEAYYNRPDKAAMRLVSEEN
jgi:GTP-dependent phosphoenolpyruvate carboxykinase